MIAVESYLNIYLKKILDKLPKRIDILYILRRVRKKFFEWENDVEELNNDTIKKKELVA